MFPSRRVFASSLLLALLAGAAHAQSSRGAGGPAAIVNGGSETTIEAAAETPASNASATLDQSQTARIEEITFRGAAVPRERRVKFEQKLGRITQNLDAEVELQGGTIVAARLASEFNTVAEDLIREEARHGCGWAELVIAYTLVANSKNGETAGQLLIMRDARTGWGQIAAGMGFRLEDVTGAVKTEVGVARGSSQADGKVAIVRGEGSIHDAGGAAASMRSGAGVSAVGASATVKAGASVAVPRVKAN